MTLRLRRGGIALCDVGGLITPELQAMMLRHVPAAAVSAREQRDGSHGRTHVTIAFNKEWRQALQSSGTETEELFEDAAGSGMADLSGLQIKGLGTAGKENCRCWYLVMEWPAAAAWRARHGLPPHDFHMTVGYLAADVHGVCKDSATLIEALEVAGLEPEPEPEPAAAAGPLTAPEAQPAAAVGSIGGRPKSFYCVMDFEATCEDRAIAKRWKNEIIEFPAVLVDAATLKPTGAEFREFVRPTEVPRLTPFCTALTSIVQADVVECDELGSVMGRFNSWLAEQVLAAGGVAGASNEVLPVTCGDWDLGTQLPNECERKGLTVPSVLKTWCNIKRPYGAVMREKARGMDAMLKGLKIPLIGRHHLGIDDARNIASIATVLGSAPYNHTIVADAGVPWVSPRPPFEPEGDPEMLRPLLEELVNLTTLYQHLNDRSLQCGDPDPSDPVDMRSLMKNFRAETLRKAAEQWSVSPTDWGAHRLCEAKAGSTDAKALTHALKHTIRIWSAVAVVVGRPDTWVAPGGLATPVASYVGGPSLVRTLSAQARRQAELARKGRQAAAAAEDEEAALSVELAEAQRELDRYREQQKPRGGAGGVNANGSGRKTLICIRHGKSLAQGVPNRQRKVGMEYTDAKLASTGRQQALDLASALQKHKATDDDEPATAAAGYLSLMHLAELVVVSPLTRALQTVCNIFSDSRPDLPPFICHPAVAEIGGIPENIARPLSALHRDTDLTRLERFSTVDFSLEAEPAWPPTARPHKQSRTAAADKFLAWLKERPEEVVVLVSHHNFLQGLLKTTASVPNCMPIVVEVDTEGQVKHQIM